MDFYKVINSPEMWIASSLMVIVVVLQSVFFFVEAWKESKRIGISQARCSKAIRSAIITSIGPSLAPVLVLMALIPVLGGPTTWMRVCDIGAAETELAIATMSAKIIGIDLRSAAYDIHAFSYSLWGMALNNLGWLLFTLLFTHKMSRGLQKLNEKCDPIWVKYLMAGAALGLFGYLLSGQVISKGSIRMGHLYAGVVAGGVMFILSKIGKKYRAFREPALGIAMIIGMIAAAVLV
jgi:hypothetical protein